MLILTISEKPERVKFSECGTLSKSSGFIEKLEDAEEGDSDQEKGQEREEYGALL